MIVSGPNQSIEISGEQIAQSANIALKIALILNNGLTAFYSLQS